MTCTVPPPLYSLPPIQKRVGDGTYGYVNLVRSKKTQKCGEESRDLWGSRHPRAPKLTLLPLREILLNYIKMRGGGAEG